MHTESARNVGAQVRRPLVASLMALAVLWMAPGTASASAEYGNRTDSLIYTCPPSGDTRYQCDRHAYGAEAWITATDSSGTYTAAKVEFHPYGEHLYVHDNYTNTRYAWAHVKRRLDYHHEWTYETVRSSYYIHQNFDWPEEHDVWIRACEGTYSDFDAYGCTDWAFAES